MEDNIIRFKGNISKDQRQIKNNHKSLMIWITGLSGSGKSTLAHAIEYELHKLKKQVYVLDGDNMRKGLNRNLGFSPEDRRENIRRIGEVGKLFVDAGMIVVAAFISPYKEDREYVRGLLEYGEFLEVYLDCSLAVCEKRDVKGLYKKARAGSIKQFTGIDAPYEVPENSEICIQSDERSIVEGCEQVLTFLEDKKYLST
ncbi:MAG: adenylylsulfate kinase [Candidatus Omnitrophota bacterium]|jgi:adenylylsulfate kinase